MLQDNSLWLTQQAIVLYIIPWTELKLNSHYLQADIIKSDEI